MQWRLFQGLCNVLNCFALRVKLHHHPVHERVPRQGKEEVIEQFGDTQFVYHPIITVAVDNRLVKIKYHHYVGHFDIFVRGEKRKIVEKNTFLCFLKREKIVGERGRGRERGGGFHVEQSKRVLEILSDRRTPW